MNEAQAILELGAQRVRILGVINRSDKGKHRASPRCNDRVKEFNQALQREMYRSDKPIHFWYHKGLFITSNRIHQGRCASLSGWPEEISPVPASGCSEIHRRYDETIDARTRAVLPNQV